MVATVTAAHLLADPAGALSGPVRLRLADGRIAAIEPTALDRADPSGVMAMPAPVNAHDHGRGLRPIAFGAADDTLEVWIPALSMEPVVDPYLRAAVAFARMAEGGVCAANHCHVTQKRDRLVEEARAVSRAARDVGVRIAFALPIMNRNAGVYGNLETLYAKLDPADRAALQATMRPFRSWQECLELVEAIAAFEHDLFEVQLHPIAPQWVDDETLAAVARLSEATGRRVHTHLLETRAQRAWADAAYPGGLIRRLDDFGLLSPRLSLAHGVWLRPDECELLAARGVALSVNTSSNLRLRSGLPPVERFRDTGLAFGLGLDGMSFDDDEDMLREARLFWRLNRGFAGEDVLGPGDLFDALCRTGRRTIVGDDGGGVLAAGAPADVLLLDTKAMLPDDCGRDVPILDLMLTRMAKRHITGLIVAGREVVRDGRCVTVDLPALEADLSADARRAAAATPVDRGRIARLQAAISSFYACGCHTQPTSPVFAEPRP